MKRARIRGAALVVACAASTFSVRVAAADCVDQSCPTAVSEAMAKSGDRFPLVLSGGLRSLSYGPSARDRFDGGVDASPTGYQFSGDALGSTPLRAYGAELGADWAFSPFAYLGGAAAWGAGSWSASPFTAGAMTVEPRATVNTQIWLTGVRGGLRLPLGPVSLRVEVLGGGEWVALQQFASTAGGRMTANASTVEWLVEPRAAFDLWTSPYTAVSVFGAMPQLDARAANGGIMFAWHWRSFDGRYSGVL